MVNGYTVGALGEFLATVKKNKKIQYDEYMKANANNGQSELNLIESLKIKNLEVFKEEKPLITPNELKIIKDEKSLINPNKLKRKKKDNSIKPNDKEEKSPTNPNKIKRVKKEKEIIPNDNVEIFNEEKSSINPNKLKKKKKDKSIKPNDKVGGMSKEGKSPTNPNKIKRIKKDKSIKPNDKEGKSPTNPNKIKKIKKDKSIKPNDKEGKSPTNPNKIKRIKKDKLIKPTNKSGQMEKKTPASKLEDIKSSEEYIEKESRTIFVGNVPVNVKMSALKKLFKQFGEIETMRLRSVAVKSLDLPRRVSIIKGNFHPQRDTANVYIRFKTIDAAQKALCLNSTKFEQHTIRVDMSLNSDHKQNKKKAIFIGNLSYNIQEDEVWDFFRDCGIVTAVRIVRDNVTGISKGFGFVDFESKDSVEFAMQLQGKKIQNREIRIKRIDTRTNAKNVFNKSFDKRPVQFKRTKPSFNAKDFQGETMKSKSQKKKGKLTKDDLIKKKLAKQLNG